VVRDAWVEDDSFVAAAVDTSAVVVVAAAAADVDYVTMTSGVVHIHFVEHLQAFAAAEAKVEDARMDSVETVVVPKQPSAVAFAVHTVDVVVAELDQIHCWKNHTLVVVAREIDPLVDLDNSHTSGAVAFVVAVEAAAVVEVDAAAAEQLVVVRKQQRLEWERVQELALEQEPTIEQQVRSVQK